MECLGYVWARLREKFGAFWAPENYTPAGGLPFLSNFKRRLEIAVVQYMLKSRKKIRIYTFNQNNSIGNWLRCIFDKKI